MQTQGGDSRTPHAVDSPDTAACWEITEHGARWTAETEKHTAEDGERFTLVFSHKDSFI